jgi:signal peptidase I
MINTARGRAVSIFGNYTLKVVTGSMEPTIMTGDFIIVHKASPEQLQVNDIITFYSDSPETKDLLITHRIIGIKDDGTFITKGDANNIEDQVSARPERVLGKYVRKARYLGIVSSFADMRKLILLLVIVPMFVISIFEVKSLAAVWKKVRQESGAELTEEQIRQQEIERIKKLAVEEYMNKEKEKESDGEEERDS